MAPLTGKGLHCTLKWLGKNGNKSELYSPLLYLQQCIVCLKLACSAKQSIFYSEETFVLSISCQCIHQHVIDWTIFVKFNSRMALSGAWRWLSTIDNEFWCCNKTHAVRPWSRVPWRAHTDIAFYWSGFINFVTKRFQRMLSCLLFFELPSFFSCVNPIDTQSRFMNTARREVTVVFNWETSDVLQFKFRNRSRFHLQINDCQTIVGHDLARRCTL